jgi:hypothetical protein
LVIELERSTGLEINVHLRNYVGVRWIQQVATSQPRDR